MRKKLFLIFIVFVISFSVIAKTTEKRLWNLQNASIRAVISAVAKATKKNFIIDPRVHGTISIISSRPISNKAAYKMFLSAIRILGYSAIYGHNAIEIVPNINARSEAARVETAKINGISGEMVVRVIHLKYANVSMLVPILRPLISDWGSISAYKRSNLLIIADSASNITKILKLLKSIDAPPSNSIEIIHIKNGSAKDIVNAINKIHAFSGDKEIFLSADETDNAILLSGNKKEKLKTKILIEELDNNKNFISQNSRVIHLSYLNAKKLAPILTKIANTQEQRTKAKIKTTVTANTETNSIIINSTHKELMKLINIVHQLDLKPRQVLVEAVIAQVDEKMMQKLGIMWGTDESGSAFSSGFQEGIGIIKTGNIRLLLSALMNDSSSDILSTPSIMVLNNQTAQIKVGKNVGIQNRQYAQETGTDQSAGVPYNTYERKDVALSLHVTPHITPRNDIQLKIKQENDTLENPQNPGDNPVINTDQINTDVIVKNGTILVLGGLINHNLEKNTKKLPILGNIPLLGDLFKYKNNQVEKKNLMLFIRPIILTNQTTANKLTVKQYNFIRSKELLHKDNIGIITNLADQPLLASLTKKTKLPNPFK